MANESPSTQTIAAVIIIFSLATLLACLFFRSRLRSRTSSTPVFGHFRSISRHQAALSRHQSGPSRLQQVVIHVPPSADHESLCSSILPGYDVEKPPPAYLDEPTYDEPETGSSRVHSIDITDIVRSDVQRCHPRSWRRLYSNGVFNNSGRAIASYRCLVCNYVTIFTTYLYFFLYLSNCQDILMTVKQYWCFTTVEMALWLPRTLQIAILKCCSPMRNSRIIGCSYYIQGYRLTESYYVSIDMYMVCESLLTPSCNGCSDDRRASSAKYSSKPSSLYLSVSTRTLRTRGNASFLLRTAICFWWWR